MEMNTQRTTTNSENFGNAYGRYSPPSGAKPSKVTSLNDFMLLLFTEPLVEI